MIQRPENYKPAPAPTTMRNAFPSRGTKRYQITRNKSSTANGKKPSKTRNLKQNHFGDDLFENAKKDRSLFGGSFDYVDTFESFNKDNYHD